VKRIRWVCCGCKHKCIVESPRGFVMPSLEADFAESCVLFSPDYVRMRGYTPGWRKVD